MTTLPCLSTILPPWDQTSQWHHVLASPVALPSANPTGVPFALSAWHILRNPALSFGKVSKPAAFIWLTRCTRQAPATPMGTATHLPLSVQYSLPTGYQPPYLPPR